MGKIQEQDRPFLDALVKGLKGTAGKPMSKGGITYDGELAGKLREAYDTIGKLEKRNHNLIEILESLKGTYEFFEISTDMGVLYGNPMVIR